MKCKYQSQSKSGLSECTLNDCACPYYENNWHDCEVGYTPILPSIAYWSVVYNAK